MRARKYNKRVSFYQTTTVPDGYGGFTVSDSLIATSWCEIKTVSNNSRFNQRITNLGITDPNNAIIIQLRHRNDIDYSAINQYVLYRNVKYVIQNAPVNIDLEGVDIEIIATKEATIG